MTIELEFDRPSRGAAPLRKARPAHRTHEAHRADGQDRMTVGDLIALLEDVDPTAPVVIAGQYGGYDSVRGLSRVPLTFDVNQLEGFGRHEQAASGERADAVAIAVIVETTGGSVE